MPSAHEAAVEAMAGAACLFRRDVAPGQCMAYDDVGEPAVHPECALAALVRSEAVRAALVEPMFEALVEYSSRQKRYKRDDLCPPLVDAILAALAGGEAGPQ